MKNFILPIILFVIISGCSDSEDENIISASGTIEATNVIVSSKAAGQVSRILVNEGDKVKAGDIIAEIEHELLDIQLRQAEANAEVTLAQLRLLESGARPEDINQAREMLNQAKINLEQSKTDMDRMISLYQSQSITKKQQDDAIAKYELNRTQYNAAIENYKKVRTIVRPQEIESAKANLKRNLANVDLLKKNIEDSRIISPVDGIVTKKFIEQGETISPSASIVKISDLNVVNLVIYVSETELGKVKPGQSAEIKVDTYPDKIYKGNIIFISPEAEFTPKNIQTKDERTKLVFAVKIEIPNNELELKPGLPADANVYLNK